MPSRHRKKVTRSGKGAFSLYLPKKWIDGWSQEQRKDRVVDLIQIDEYLIVAPAKRGKAKSVLLENGSTDAVKQFLLSSYARGYEAADIRSNHFTDEQICGARSFARLLDEKLILDITEKRISYGKDFGVTIDMPSVTQMQRLQFEKLLESLRLCHELLQYFDHNRRRTVHLLRMLRTLEEEDLDRMAMQIMRRAARMEILFDSFADLYYVVLTTDLLEKTGDSVYGIARCICRLYSLDEERLLFPLEALVKEVSPPERLPQSMEGLREVYLESLRKAEDLLRSVTDMTLERRGREAYEFMEQLSAFRGNLGKEMSAAMRNLPFGEENERGRIIQIMQVGHYINAIATFLEEFARQTALFYYCEDLPEIGQLADQK